MIDPERFDELAVAAATEPISRGRVLKMLAAALLGGGGLLMGAEPAEARCQRVGRRCAGAVEDVAAAARAALGACVSAGKA